MLQQEARKNYFELLTPMQNASSLTHAMEKSGFEIWHHCFSAKSQKNNHSVYFFINFMLLNSTTPVEDSLLGQQQCGLVYAGMMGSQSNFYMETFDASEISSSKRILNLRMGSNVCLEDGIVGHLIQDGEHPLTKMGVGSIGSISFDLKIHSYVRQEGNLPISFPYLLNGYELYWYTPALRTTYEGHIVVNEEEFKIEKSMDLLGYRDKIWGHSFPDYWVRLYGGVMQSSSTDIAQEQSGFLLLCHSATLWNYNLGKKSRIELIINGKSYEFIQSTYSQGLPYTLCTHEGKEAMLFQAENSRYKIHIYLYSSDKNFSAIQFPTPQDFLKKFLINVPVSLKIDLFMIKGIMRRPKLIEEISIKGAIFEQG